MKTQKKDLTTLAYEKGVQDYLKEVAESGSDVHENYTPAEICDIMLDKVDLTKAETVLVLYNIELLFALKKRKFSGHVTFFTQSEEKAGIAPKIFPNITVEYIDKEANPLYHMENKWPDKFDIVIANPPYSKDLDLLILEKSIEILRQKGQAVFVHPALAWIDQKGGKSLYGKLAKKIEPFLKEIVIFNGNPIFEINEMRPLSIIYLDLEKDPLKEISYKSYIFNHNSTIKSLNELHHFGNSSVIFSFLQKVESLHTKKETLKKLLKKRDTNQFSSKNFWVGMPKVRGGGNLKGSKKLEQNSMWLPHFFTCWGKNKTYRTQLEGIDEYMFIEFDTNREAKNFISYMQTDFARFCLGLYKKDFALNSNVDRIPLVDFTQKWTDEKLYAHFSITEEEQTFIKEVIPPYYD